MFRRLPIQFQTEEPTTELYMGTILDRKDCKKHNSAVGVPCWFIVSEGEVRFGICNSRAERAGFVGEISEVARGKNLKPSKHTSNNI